MAKNASDNRPGIVLVASDQEWTSRSLDSILSPKGFAVVHARKGAQVLDLVAAVSPDAVIIDAGLREPDGYALCRSVRQATSKNTPVVIISALPAARADRIRAYTAGAWVFLSQPIDGEVLLLQLSTYLDAKEAADLTRDEHLLDPSTGLYSLRGLTRRAREIGAEAVRLRTPLTCVAITPIVHADGVQETFNTEADSPDLISYMGAILRSSSRISDAIGRSGEKEFGVVAPGTDAGGAEKFVDRLRCALEKEPFRLNGRRVAVDVGVGYHASENFAESPIDAMEMLLKASSTMRSSLTSHSDTKER